MVFSGLQRPDRYVYSLSHRRSKVSRPQKLFWIFEGSANIS